MKEQLRLSLDKALEFQELLIGFRNVIRKTSELNPQLNDGLVILMTGVYNGLGRTLLEMDEQVELINERIAIYGNGEGMVKQAKIRFLELDDIEEVDEDEED